MTDLQKSEDVRLYRRVSKDGEHAPHGFKRIHDNEPVFATPTLLCCGGIFANTHNKDGEKNANGYAKIGHGLACYPESFAVHKSSTHQPDIDILSVCYPEGDSRLMNSHHRYIDNLKNRVPTKPTEFAQRFAEQRFFPLLQTEDGAPRPLAEVKRKLRNVQVLAHSYGNTFIQQVGDVLVDHLAQLNFTPEQIKEATSQVLVVSAGPITPPATGKAAFTTVNIININDTEIRNSYFVLPAIKELLLKTDRLVDKKNEPVPPDHAVDMLHSDHRYYAAKPLNILPVQTVADGKSFHFSRSDQSNQWLVSASPPIFINGLGDIIDVPVIPTAERSNERGEFDGKQSLSSDYTHHQGLTYFTNKRPQVTATQSHSPSEHTEHASTLRTMMSSVLINGLNNAMQNNQSETFTPLANADELMQLPQRSEYITALDVPLRRVAKLDRYEEKIANGLSNDRPQSIAHIR